MELFFNILAAVSFVIALFPNLVNVGTLIYYYLNLKHFGGRGLKIGIGPFVWLVLLIWPVFYYFFK